jgi:anti-sigma factor RsiW
MHEDYSVQHRMNNALDEELSEEELAALAAELEDAPEAAEQFESLRKTDKFLRETPMVAPSSHFAKRVMDALATLPLPGFAKHELSVGLALGLAAAAFLAIPVLAMLLFLIVSLLTDPTTLSTLLQASIDILTFSVGLAADVADRLRELVRATPILAVGLVLVVPLAGVWSWFMWVLMRGRNTTPRQRRV